jgi:hypothetical protein
MFIGVKSKKAIIEFSGLVIQNGKVSFFPILDYFLSQFFIFLNATVHFASLNLNGKLQEQNHFAK